jgi:transcriptional regulator with XRE-family HTH domain
MEHLLQTIRRLREDKGLTQEEMAFRLHMSQKSYCQLENGITRLDVGRLVAISEVLGINPADLFQERRTAYNFPIHYASRVQEPGGPLPDLHGLNHKINRLIQLLETRSPLR